VSWFTSCYAKQKYSHIIKKILLPDRTITATAMYVNTACITHDKAITTKYHISWTLNNSVYHMSNLQVRGSGGAKPPWSWKHFYILKLLGCCFPGLFQPNTQELLAIQVHNHRSLNDAQIRGGGAPLRGGGAELRWAPPYFHHWRLDR